MPNVMMKMLSCWTTSSGNIQRYATESRFNSKVYIVGESSANPGKNNFNLIGYDLLERNVACLKQGSVYFLIAQQPELQGYNGIKALCDHLIFKKEVNCINYMPIDLLTVETIDYYSNK